MNPFDFTGPEFLLFYLFFGIAVLFVASRMRRARESGMLPQLPLNDPYLIAFLGGGREGVVRAGLVSLIDQDVLTVSADRMVGRGPKWSENAAHNAIEKDLLRYANSPKNLHEMFQEPTLAYSTARYEETLKASRLLPSAEDIAMRRRRIATVVLVLGGVSLIKIMVALNRGHRNIGFLILMTIVFVLLAIKQGTPRRTQIGDDFLAGVRGVFSDIKNRAPSMRPGSVTTELLWLTAVFGLGSLPTDNFPFVKYFRPANNVTGGSTCGSGCGSSGGDGGGGCGGGGCGGGCGGCGG